MKSHRIVQALQSSEQSQAALAFVFPSVHNQPRTIDVNPPTSSRERRGRGRRPSPRRERVLRQRLLLELR
jgi:hypothetical protein